MKRHKSQSVIQRNQTLLKQIKKVKVGHPLWGYQRVCSYLKYRQNIPVNKKRIYRLMKENNLLITPQWINDYNTDYPHQSLNNLTPRQCYEKFINKKLVSNLKMLD